MRSFVTQAVLVACIGVFASAQFNPSKPPAKPVKSDIQYIKCQVCELLAKNAYRQVNDMKKALRPNQKLPEMAVIELMEHITDPTKDQGEWIAKIDLVESGDKLLLEEQKELGDCGVECKTVQRAAEEIVGDNDTDLAEELWKLKMTRSQFTNWLCGQLTKSCKTKPPKLPADRKPGPPFTVLDEQQAQLQKMMAGMKEQGMGGTVYDRDTIMKKYMNGYDDDYEDDDEEEEGPSAVRGKQPSGAAKGTVGKLAEKASNVAESALSYTQEKLSSAFSQASNLLAGDKKAAPTAEL
ncbi:hypothetical protein ABBQ38_012958 [Trebouxia sp. C0009 RCD-2024]